MRELSSFDELLRLLNSLEGRFMAAGDSSGALCVSGPLARQKDDHELDELAERDGIVGEDAEMYWVGEGGRIALFPSAFDAATWDEASHRLTINVKRGTVVLTDEYWGK